VSICSVRDLKPISLLELLDQLDQVLEPASQAVKSPDHERVASAQVVKTRVELGSMPERSRSGVAVDPRAAGVGERVELQVEVLQVSRDARIADQ
jgi:hypothetical protein